MIENVISDTKKEEIVGSPKEGNVPSKEFPEIQEERIDVGNDAWATPEVETEKDKKSKLNKIKDSIANAFKGKSVYEKYNKDELRKKISEDLRSLAKIKSFDAGLGGLGNMSFSSSAYDDFIKKYEIVKDETINDLLDKLKNPKNAYDRKDNHLKLISEMHKKAEERISQLQ